MSPLKIGSCIISPGTPNHLVCSFVSEYFEKILLGFPSHTNHMRKFKFRKLSDVENIVFF